MMGSLPSTYLKWVSRNLRAGDTEEWAKLADQVLGDPVYRDRIEWEMVENILNGNAASASSRSDNNNNAVSELLEISERFGWDNEDKSGWSKIDFGLLGTSKGGRIPRLVAESKVELGSLEKKEKDDEAEEQDGRARRRERIRRRMSEKTSTQRKMGNRREEEEEGGSPAPPNGVVVRRRSPFPGREAFLNKLLNRQGLL